MRCLGPVYAGRTPALVRPPASSRAPSFHGCPRAVPPCGERELARSYPSHGQTCSHNIAPQRAPPGRSAAATRRMRRCLAMPGTLSAPSRPPRIRHRSRMLPTIKAHGGSPATVPTLEAKMLFKDDSLQARRTCRAPPGGGQRGHAGRAGSSVRTCYLVDPASSHMLVSKIKPCMCKYELIRTVKLRMAH